MSLPTRGTATTIDLDVSMTEQSTNTPPGTDASIQDLLPLVYEELRTLASHYLALPGERAHTLQPTALVHEAYLKLGAADKRWSGRDHFMAVASIAMRQVLVDHARRKQAEKRGGGVACVDISIDGIAEDPQVSRELRVLELHDLLTRLAELDARAAQITEMRLFGGMSQDQISHVLGISRMTVTTDWRFARAWLASRIKGERNVP
jgi:RNA polymerase sigma factor (TIGR02999 family)